MEKGGEKGYLGNFGQVWASLDKLGQGNKLVKWGKKAEKIKKENKDLSGNGGGEEGENRV